MGLRKRLLSQKKGVSKTPRKVPVVLDRYLNTRGDPHSELPLGDGGTGSTDALQYLVSPE
jgi:hypothetical protein